MRKCDPRVFAKCPDREFCECQDDATFAAGSECDKYNEKVLSQHPMTNADRIRAMSDEELAVLFAETTFCPIGLEKRLCRFMSCKKCWTNWLQQPCEGGADSE